MMTLMSTITLECFHRYNFTHQCLDSKYKNEDITNFTSTFNANDIVLENEDFVITSDKNQIKLKSNQVISFSFSMDSTSNENMIFDKLVFVPSHEQIEKYDLGDTVAVKFENGAKLNLHEILKNKRYSFD